MIATADVFALFRAAGEFNVINPVEQTPLVSVLTANSLLRGSRMLLPSAECASARRLM
jgi:hypothetical protein